MRKNLVLTLVLAMLFTNTAFASADTAPDLNDMAAVLNGNFSGSGSAYIDGDLYTANGNVQIGWTMLSTGDFYHKTGTAYTYPLYGGTYNGYNTKNKELASTSYNESFPALAQFPDIPNYVAVASNQTQSLVISEDTHFGTLKVSSNTPGRDVIFDVHDDDLFVVADTLDISVWKTISVVGTHTLFLYIGNYKDINAKPFLLTNPSGNPSQIYVVSKDYIPLHADTPLVGNLLYSGIANIITGGFVAVTGSVITDAATVWVSGADPFQGLFYAPNAAVTMSGSAKITGRLVADSLIMLGSSKIIYSDQYSTLILPDEVLPKYTVSTAVAPAGAGTISPASSIVVEGDTIHFTVTPAAGYTFSGFTSSNPSMMPDGSNNMVVTGDVTITANFTAIPGSGYVNGILGEYYDSPNPNNASALKMKRIDNNIAFNFEYNSPTPNAPEAYKIQPDNFAMRWTGYIKPAVTGDYTFKTYSDDGVKLTVNGNEIINNWGLFTLNFEISDTTVHLEAGQYYPITLEYQQMPLYAAVFLFWEAPNVPMGLVPASVFYVEEAIYDEFISPKYYNPLESAGTGFLNKFYAPAQWPSGTPAYEEINNIDYSWGAEAPEGIETDDFYGRMEGWLEAKFTEEITLIFTVDDSVRVWLDDVKVIDEWGWNSQENFSYTFNTVAGQKYKIKVEYEEKGIGATLVMGWMSQSLGGQVVPKEQMYSTN
ncbi:hypothetical protein MASR2M70_22170 [Bacillota bacterium]